MEELVARIHTRLRPPRIEMHDVVSYADLMIDVTLAASFSFSKKS